MGLDVCCGMPRYVYYFSLLRDCLRRVDPTLGDPSFSEVEECLGRAYPFREFAEHCRNEGLPYPHIQQLTCGQFQLIAHIDFAQPILEFTDKTPSDYNISIIKPHKDGFPMDSYPYYVTTPWQETFMLSAPQLKREASDFLGKMLPDWRPADFTRNTLFDLRGLIHDAGFLFYCCKQCVDKDAPLWFCG